jgi:hypothetical protein
MLGNQPNTVSMSAMQNQKKRNFEAMESTGHSITDGARG